MVYCLLVSVFSVLFLTISCEDACLNHLLPNVLEQMDGFSKVSNFLTENLVIVKNLRCVKPIWQYYELLPYVTFSFKGPFNCTIPRHQQISHFTDSFITILNVFCAVVTAEFHIYYILFLFMFPLSWLLHKKIARI